MTSIRWRPSESDKPERPKATGADPFEILIVDDNRDAADVLGLYLEKKGHKVLVAYSGEEGVALTRERKPDLILMDLAMRGLGGLEAVRQIRMLQNGRNAIVVALSGFGNPSDLSACWSVGFDGHLTKPVSPDNLLSLLAILKG